MGTVKKLVSVKTTILFWFGPNFWKMTENSQTSKSWGITEIVPLGPNIRGANEAFGWKVSTIILAYGNTIGTLYR